MLIRLLPEQVSTNWSKLAPLISVGLNPAIGYSRQGMVNVLRAILLESLVCWAYEDDGKFIFLLVTQVKKDEVTLDRQLLIWSFASIREISNRMFKDAFASLSRFAKSNSCRSIIGYVADDRFVDFYVNEFGASADFKFVEVEI